MRQVFPDIETLQDAANSAASPLTYVPLGPEQGPTEWEDLLTDGVRVSRVRFAAPMYVQYKITPSGSQYVLPLWTPDPPTIDGEVLDRGTVWTGHPHQEGRAVFNGPMEVLDLLLPAEGDPPQGDPGPNGVRYVGPSASDEISARAVRALLLLAAGATPAQLRSAAESVGDALRSGLAQTGPMTCPSQATGDVTDEQLVDRALAHIQDSTDPSVAELAAHVGASRSALYRSFHNVCGIGPYEFVQSRRLTLLHERLLGASPVPGRISREAAALGLHHFGHMARHYRRLFGELPSETLKRRRAAPFGR